VGKGRRSQKSFEKRNEKEDALVKLRERARRRAQNQLVGILVDSGVREGEHEPFAELLGSEVSVGEAVKGGVCEWRRRVSDEDGEDGKGEEATEMKVGKEERQKRKERRKKRTHLSASTRPTL